MGISYTINQIHHPVLLKLYVIYTGQEIVHSLKIFLHKFSPLFIVGHIIRLFQNKKTDKSNFNVLHCKTSGWPDNNQKLAL